MTARQRVKVLMCAPDYFTLDHAINPWMAGNEGTLDLNLARCQWQQLHDELSRVADIELMQPQPLRLYMLALGEPG